MSAVLEAKMNVFSVTDQMLTRPVAGFSHRNRQCSMVKLCGQMLPGAGLVKTS